MLLKGDHTLPKDIRNILLIQLGDIGDVVLTTLTIRALCENFPESHLVITTEEKAKGLLEDCPWISKEISIDKRKRPFKQAIRH